MLDEDLVFSIEDNENTEINTEIDVAEEAELIESEIEDEKIYLDDNKNMECQKQKEKNIFKRIWKKYITKRKRTKAEILGDALFLSGVFIFIVTNIVNFIQNFIF